jgi:hypothetical protein
MFRDSQPKKDGESTFRRFDSVDEGTMVLRNVDNFSVDTAYLSRRNEYFKKRILECEGKLELKYSIDSETHILVAFV